MVYDPWWWNESNYRANRNLCGLVDVPRSHDEYQGQLELVYLRNPLFLVIGM